HVAVDNLLGRLRGWRRWLRRRWWRRGHCHGGGLGIVTAGAVHSQRVRRRSGWRYLLRALALYRANALIDGHIGRVADGPAQRRRLANLNGGRFSGEAVDNRLRWRRWLLNLGRRRWWWRRGF